jgi:hypothetical protein
MLDPCREFSGRADLKALSFRIAWGTPGSTAVESPYLALASPDPDVPAIHDVTARVSN